MEGKARELVGRVAEETRGQVEALAESQQGLEIALCPQVSILDGWMLKYLLCVGIRRDVPVRSSAGRSVARLLGLVMPASGLPYFPQVFRV